MNGGSGDAKKQANNCGICTAAAQKNLNAELYCGSVNLIKLTDKPYNKLSERGEREKRAVIGTNELRETGERPTGGGASHFQCGRGQPITSRDIL